MCITDLTLFKIFLYIRESSKKIAERIIESASELYSYLTVRNLDITPSAIYHMTLSETSQLRLITSKSNKAKSFALAGFCIFLYLRQDVNVILHSQSAYTNKIWCFLNYWYLLGVHYRCTFIYLIKIIYYKFNCYHCFEKILLSYLTAWYHSLIYLMDQ